MIPRIVPITTDKLSFAPRFRDTLSGDWLFALAATLENFRKLPTTRAVRFLLMHGNAPVYRGSANEACAELVTIHPTGGRSADAEPWEFVIERRLSS